jgi:hypothetical protein
VSTPAAAPAPAAYAPGLAPANVTAIVGFVLAVVGVVAPIAVLTLAGGIVSIVGLRRAKFLADAGVPATGRGFAIAGIIIGFGLTIVAIIALVLVITALSSLASQLGNFNPSDFGDLGGSGDLGDLGLLLGGTSGR